MPEVESAQSPETLTPLSSPLLPEVGAATRARHLPSPGERVHASHPAFSVQGQKTALGFLC